MGWGMASSAAAPASKGPRYAPPDPTLPKPWRGLIDGNTGYLYFWNPETKVTQYERPVAAVPSSPSQPPGYSRPEERPRSSAPSEQRSEAAVSRPQYVPPSDNRARNDHSEPRSASGVNLSQSAPSANQVSQAANGSQMSPEAYRAKHEITIVGNEAPAPFMTFQSTGFPSEMLREQALQVNNPSRGSTCLLSCTASCGLKQLPILSSPHWLGFCVTKDCTS